MGSHSSKSEKEVKQNTRDIRLLVPDESGNMHTIVVPKQLLVQHSVLFRNMVERGTLKKVKKFTLEDVSAIGVLKTLECVEHGKVKFESVNDITETFKVAEKYQIDGIEETCLHHLYENLNSSTVCEAYEFAIRKDLHELIYKCLKIIDEETDQVLNHKSFTKLKIETVIDILKRDTLMLNSEYKLLEAVIKWGKAEMQRLGHDTDYYLKRLLQPVLVHVRFQHMTPNEMADPTVNEFLASLSATPIKDMKFGITSKLGLSEIDSKRENNLILHNEPRIHRNHYTHELEVHESDQPAIVNGEIFLLQMEIIKGKVFLIGMNLAFKTFSTKMNSSCLYAILTARNMVTGEQKKTRGTFLDSTIDTFLSFAQPLFLKDNDQAKITLHVKMAGNICPLTRKNDVDVVVPKNKDIALKILQDSSSTNSARCIFKSIMYFY